MTTWTIEKGLRVAVNKMGSGTVTKVTTGGAMVMLDEYKVEVEILRDWMQPLAKPSVSISGQNLSENDNSEDRKETESHQYSDAAFVIMTAMGIIPSEQNSSTVVVPPPESVEAVNSTSESKPDMRKPISYVNSDPKVLLARRAVESLRFGLVPHGYIDQLTLGYNELKEWSLEILPKFRGNKPGMFKIVGPFGTGKSHTIAVMRYIAEQEGYLTAKVEVDGQMYSLSEPARLLHTLINSLHGESFQSETPLLQLCKKALSAGYNAVDLKREQLNRAAINMTTIERLLHSSALDAYEDEVESVISGSDEITPPDLKRRIVKEFPSLRMMLEFFPPITKSLNNRANNFVEALHSTTRLIEMSGYKGLVLFIDEFEVEAVGLSRLRLDRVNNQIKLIGDHMNKYQVDGDPSLPMSIVFGTVGDEDDLAESEINVWLSQCSGSSFQLHIWNKEERVELARKIFNLYKLAYNVNEPYQDLLALNLDQKLTEYGDDDSGLIRRYIKWYVSLLDMKYGPPGESER